MENRRRWSVVLALLAVLAFSGCREYRRSHSILKTVPRISHSIDLTPELVDGPKGRALGIGGAYADSDTSIGVPSASVSVRVRASTSAKAGFTSSFLSVTEIPYTVVDVKLSALQSPVAVSPVLAFGLGFGAAFICDLRTSLIVGVPLLGGRVTPHVVPKFMLLSYPNETSSDISFRSKLARCSMIGFDGGLVFSFPLAQSEGKAQSLHFRPHFTHWAGTEPNLDRVEFHRRRLLLCFLRFSDGTSFGEPSILNINT